jgi:hypothetical protein
MNFHLKSIESAVQEKALLQAEELLEDGGVGRPIEVEKNLFVSNVKGYEVEAQLKGQKVVEGSCDCDEFSKKSECGHFVALLMRIRQLRQDQKKHKKKTRKTKYNKRLTTSVVLEQVDHNELVAFVREYARTNRNFSIALKARFASSVVEFDNNEKYSQLLDSTISAVRRPDRTITLRGARRLLKVLNELDRQLVLSISEDNYLEASHIAKSVIGRLSPVLNKITGEKEAVTEKIHKAFDHIAILIQKKAAPKLRADLKNYLFGECHKLVYRPNQLDIPFFRILQSAVDDKEEKRQFLNALAIQKEKYAHENRPLTPLILLELNTLEEDGQTESAKILMEQNLNQPDVLDYAIGQAQQKGLRARVLALAEMGLSFNFPNQYIARLEDLLLNMAEEDKEKELIYKYAFSRFCYSLDFDYYTKAKAHAKSKKHWSSEVEELIKKLKTQSYSLERQIAIATILMKEKKEVELMQLLEDTGSLILLTKFDRYLLSYAKDRIYELYRRLIDRYTQQYLGHKAANKVREVIAHLLHINANDLALELLLKLRNQYPERHTLMEALDIFNI